ncbi:MAG: hypothetical protein HGA45_09535, partial [Chloroflexales bacterium]|nr:hypothetical protein [Chloroflexales bacterium]
MIAFSPDGSTLATATSDAQIILWSASTGGQLSTLLGHMGGEVTGLVFSPDGRTLASAGKDSVVRIWDVATGAERLVLNGHEHAVRSMAISPDGST